MRAGTGQPVVGVAVIIGAALAAVGVLLPWIDIAGHTFNGFDVGYLTKGNGNGKDGIILLVLALAVVGLAVYYLWTNSSWAILGVLVLGAGAAGVAVYDLGRVISDLRDTCGDCNPMPYVGMGMYFAVAGGVITAVAAAFFGFKQGMAARSLSRRLPD